MTQGFVVIVDVSGRGDWESAGVRKCIRNMTRGEQRSDSQVEQTVRHRA